MSSTRPAATRPQSALKIRLGRTPKVEATGWGLAVVPVLLALLIGVLWLQGWA